MSILSLLSSLLPRPSVFRTLGPGVWLVGVSWLWVNAAGISFLTFGTDYFLSRGESAAAAGLLTSFLMVGSVFLSPLAGLMIDRGWSQKAMIIVGSVLLGIVYVLIPQMKLNVNALTIVLGVAAALIPVAVFSLPARILPLGYVGLGFGIISTCLNIGITIGPCMVGIARDLVGGYYTGFVLMAVFSFLSLAAIALLKINNRHKRPWSPPAAPRLVVDDFGSGFLSFVHLRRLGIASVKIDRGLVENVESNAESSAILRSYVQSLRGIGIEAVAKCVEHPSLLPILRDHGVARVQGYAVGRPSESLVTVSFRSDVATLEGTLPDPISRHRA